MRALTVLVDLDDVMWDLLPAWLDDLNFVAWQKDPDHQSLRPKDITQWLVAPFFPELTQEQIWAPLSTDRLWQAVCPVPGAVETLQAILGAGHTIRIVTATHYTTALPKMRRLFELFPFLQWRDIIIASDKSVVMGDILIDDNPHNLENFSGARLLYDRAHNQSYAEGDNDMLRVHNWGEIKSFLDALADK